MTKSHTLSIAAPGSTRVLSPGQKKFNALVQQIGVQRQLLAAWNEGLPPVQHRHAQEFVPLMDAYGDLNASLVRLLDQRAYNKALSKTDKFFLHELICEMVGPLMHTPHAAEMKAIYNRHSAIDFDSKAKAAQDGLKQVVQDKLGIDLQGQALDAASPEELLARVQAQIEAQIEAEMEAHMAQQAAQREQARSKHQQARHKPSAKQAQAETEQANASQSIRAVYRKLASALHPDREPEITERARKTALMQRVNQAYQENDLLSLLQLQLEIEQIDQNALDGIAEDRLKHYNKVLGGQLEELQHAVQMLEHRFKQQYTVGPHERVNPATLVKVFVRHKQRLVADTQALQRQLKALGGDLKYFKLWLRQQREMAQEDAELEEFLEGIGGLSRW